MPMKSVYNDLYTIKPRSQPPYEPGLGTMCMYYVRLEGADGFVNIYISKKINKGINTPTQCFYFF